jgi:hypothetical protein
MGVVSEVNDSGLSKCIGAGLKIVEDKIDGSIKKIDGAGLLEMLLICPKSIGS